MPAPVIISCPDHGPFETRAREVAKCPHCRRSLRVPASLRRTRAISGPCTQVNVSRADNQSKEQMRRKRTAVNWPVVDNAVTGTIVSDDEYERYVAAEPSQELLDRDLDAVIAMWNAPTGPVGVQQPSVLRRALAYVDEENPVTFLGTIGIQIEQYQEKRRRKRNQPACAHCGLTHHSGGLYSASSPAMARPQVLCYIHVLAEMSVPGCVVERIA